MIRFLQPWWLLAVLSVEHGPGATSCMTQPALERSVERDDTVPRI